MKDSDKLELMDLILRFVGDRTEDKTISPKNIGTLNKPTGLNGFKRAEIGTPVFDDGIRYFIMLESLDGKRNLELTYYKESLKSSIDFY